MTDPQLYSLEAEKALIGALLINPDAADVVNLEPEDLYVDAHRRLFRAIRGLKARGVEPDIVTLADVLDRDGSLESTGGVAYMTGLMAETPWSTNVESYAVVVRDYARRRMVLRAANALAGAALMVGERIDEKIAAALDDLTRAGGGGRGARPMSEWVAALREDVSRRQEDPRDVWGIPTGFSDIDGLIGGLQPGEVFYLAGEPGVGKSKLMLSMALNMARSGAPGAIISLEMSGQAMTRRAVSSAGKVPTRMLKSGRFDDDGYAAYIAGCVEVERLPLYMSDDSSLTITGLRAELARLKAARSVTWFALDYLLLINGYEADGRQEHERSGKLSLAVKRIARDLGLAALTVNSVTKDGMDSTIPSSKQLKGSGQVVHDADLIAFLVKNTQAPAYVTLVFTKTRDVSGGLRSIDLYQHQEYPDFGPAVKMSLNGR